MFTKKYYEEYVIDSTRGTIGRTITETDIVIHAGQTGDFFPHHMDAEWCKTQTFNERIAHGTLIFSVAIGSTATSVNEVSISYGYDRIRFIRPVFIGDTIHVKVSISGKKKYKKPSHGLVTELVEVFNQKDEIVMLCEHILLVEKKSTGE
ncbi:dehydratase [Pedobacter lusitanus]|uniref:Dehydratase n=1 Tax=Pedobacter lusitanus TaxID=1503925 RepID=A0A0D0GGQ0_9SPHI|nr:MaoC/PaaZ C-terminal domain-containing protein [Pedobacter lusitanus]KIO75290.1 dehydratase [Pedobacter lusitanus]